MNQTKSKLIQNLKKRIIPAIIIQYQTLRDVPIWQLVGGSKDLDWYGNIFNEVVDADYGNKRTFFSNENGMLFSFMLSQTEITVWDSTGSRLVFQGKFPDLYTPERKGDRPNYEATIPASIFGAMIENVNLYARHKIRCSKCDTVIWMSEVAGTFYAGSYCSECWEGGVKQQEAQENYD